MDTERNTTIIAPLLRGLTFDGEKGFFVGSGYIEQLNKELFSENGIKMFRHKKGILFLPSIEDSERFSVEELQNKLYFFVKEHFQAYVEKHQSFPHYVVSEDGTINVLDPHYDKMMEKWDTFKHASDLDFLNTMEDISNEKQPLCEREKMLKNRIALVTGGAQGFGEQIVRGLVRYGAFVFIADLNFEGARALAEELNKNVGRTVAFALQTNVADKLSVKQSVMKIVSEVGGIDLLVSNAGVLKAGSVKELSLKDFRFVTDVNYIGYFICTKHVSPVMELQNSICDDYFTDIVQINSKSGLEGSNKNSAYAGGKFGGIGLTQSFAKELVVSNIKVNSICPGNFFEGPLWSDPKAGLFVQYLNAGKVPGARTIEEVKKHYENRVPMKRGCLGDDVLKALYYIIEQKYETGQAIPVTGGQNMLR